MFRFNSLMVNPQFSTSERTEASPAFTPMRARLTPIRESVDFINRLIKRPFGPHRETHYTNWLASRVLSGPVQGPHRETHYTNWWAPRHRGDNPLYEHFYDIVPKYATAATNEGADELTSALDDYLINLEAMENIPTPTDGPVEVASPQIVIPEVVPTPSPAPSTSEPEEATASVDLAELAENPPTLFTLKLNGEEVSEWWSGFYPHKWHGIEQQNYVPRKVVPKPATTTKQAGGDTQTAPTVGSGSACQPRVRVVPTAADEELRVKHLRISLARELQSKFGIMAETNHNTRVYQKTLLEMMDRLNCTSVERAQVIPYVLALVYVPSSVMIGAQRFRESEAAYQRRTDIARSTRLWRGWFLPSVRIPGPTKG